MFLLKRVKKYLSVYAGFLSNSFSIGMSFRTNFLILIVMDLFFYASSLATVDFMFDHVAKIGIWNREQFLFFVSFMLAIDHIHMTFVSENFWDFGFQLKTGKLDFNLLKPIGSVFEVFFKSIRPATMFNLPVPWACMIYFGSKAGVSLSGWVLLPFLLVAAITLLVSIEILICLLMFWTIEGFGVNFLRMQFQQVSRWPDFVYQTTARRIFSFGLPVLVVGSAPIRFLLDMTDWTLLVWMIAAILILWKLIAIAWRIGLNSYESASS